MTRKYVYGPVLFKYFTGGSIGINNVPYNVCSYSCVYCRFGKPSKLSTERRPYGDPNEIIDEIRGSSRIGDFDNVIFFSSGEPTLDSNIRQTVEAIKARFDKSVGIVTNSSLLWRRDVVNDLLAFDFVVLKIDTAVEDTWRLINRPCHDLHFDSILDGLREFSESFTGTLVTETILIKNVNTSEDELSMLGDLLGSIRPSVAFISPPYTSERWVRRPTQADFRLAREILISRLERSSVIISRPDAIEILAPQGVNSIDFLLSILGVHPLRLEQCKTILETEYNEPQKVLQSLLATGRIRSVRYGEETLFIR